MMQVLLTAVGAFVGASLASLLVYRDIRRRLEQCEKDIDALYQRTGPNRQRTWSSRN